MSEPTLYLDGRIAVHAGDCVDVIKTFADNSIDACVCDPPYGLQFMGREWDKLWRSKPGADADYVERTAGSLTSRARALPDYSASKPIQMQSWHEAWAREVFRVLKPGAHIVAFSGTRSYHRLACAIEDAGFEIRDQLAWAYGTGFPKSHDVSKGIDKAAGAERKRELAPKKRENGATSDVYAQDEWTRTIGAWSRLSDAPVTEAAATWKGWGTALKPSFEPLCVAQKPFTPAWEPICLARKPLSEPTVAANCLKWGCGALNIDACRVTVAADDPESYMRGERAIHAKRAVDASNSVSLPPATLSMSRLGRWPANIVHDNSAEVLAAFPKTGVNGRPNCAGIEYDHSGDVFGKLNRAAYQGGYMDSGSAARFFFSAKADSDDRLGSKHPTVKPVDLMQWLCRLVTPPGGTVLDPFAGTGTTGEAAWREGFNAVLIEREPEYLADIARRMGLAAEGQMTRKHESAKARANGKEPDHGPLFGGIQVARAAE